MKIKAGRYTLGLTFIACGVLLLLNTLNINYFVFTDIWTFSPLVLVLFGLEVLVMSMIYSSNANYKVEISGGSIILLVFVVVFLTVVVKGTDMHNTILNAIVRL